MSDSPRSRSAAIMADPYKRRVVEAVGRAIAAASVFRTKIEKMPAEKQLAQVQYTLGVTYMALHRVGWSKEDNDAQDKATIDRGIEHVYLSQYGELLTEYEKELSERSA